MKYVDLKGGKCCKCDYNNNYSCLDFHHRNPSEKEYAWNDMINLSDEQILEELEKCDVLCKNCHDNFDALKWYVDYVDMKFVVKVVNFSNDTSDKEQKIDKKLTEKNMWQGKFYN